MKLEVCVGGMCVYLLESSCDSKVVPGVLLLPSGLLQYN